MCLQFISRVYVPTSISWIHAGTYIPIIQERMSYSIFWIFILARRLWLTHPIGKSINDSQGRTFMSIPWQCCVAGCSTCRIVATTESSYGTCSIAMTHNEIWKDINSWLSRENDVLILTVPSGGHHLHGSRLEAAWAWKDNLHHEMRWNISLDRCYIWI